MAVVILLEVVVLAWLVNFYIYYILLIRETTLFIKINLLEDVKRINWGWLKKYTCYYYIISFLQITYTPIIFQIITNIS